MEDIKVLFIDDEAQFLVDVQEYFQDYNLKTMSDPVQGLAELKNTHYDIVITDYRMPDITGIELLIEAKKNNAYRFGILLTAYADKAILENAINKNLITQYIAKPILLKQLRICLDETIQKCINCRQEQKESAEYKLKYDQLVKEFSSKTDYIAGLNGGLKEVYEKIKSAGKYSIPIMLTGETGTGKEVIAKLLHQMSDRENEIFISLNCAAFPDHLIESELFGYEKGAFTGAEKTKLGKIELANGGVLFLDEIGDLKLDMQTKLLRVLQEKKIERLGSNKSQYIDFRLISATNKNLTKAIKEKTFREDLYYRINGFPIHLPPLRERLEDIEELVSLFIKKFIEEMKIDVPVIEPEIFPLLKSYKWPGNIRELEWTIKRVLILTSESGMMTKDDFDFLIPNKSDNSYKIKRAINTLKNLLLKKVLDLKDVRKLLIKSILDDFDQDVKIASEKTGISISSFYRIKE